MNFYISMVLLIILLYQKFKPVTDNYGIRKGQQQSSIRVKFPAFPCTFSVFEGHINFYISSLIEVEKYNGKIAIDIIDSTLLSCDVHVVMANLSDSKPYNRIVVQQVLDYREVANAVIIPS